MFIIAACVMLAILGTGLWYVGRRLLRWLCLIVPNANLKLLMIIPAIITASFVFAFLPLDLSIKKALVGFNWFLMGLFIFFLLFFLVSDAMVFIGKLVKIIPSPTPQTLIIAVGWAVIALVAGMAAYGTYNGRQIKQASYAVKIAKETSLKKLNIVFISDTHLGYQNDDKWLAKIVDKINALEPDIVVMAGDIFNDNFKALSNPDEAVRSLQSIKSKYGVYACWGNHDGGKTLDAMLRFLEQGNVKVLQDEYAVIDDKFIIVGRKDSSPIGYQGEPRKGLSHVLEGINASLPIIVLDHNPANIQEYGNDIDLILSGHTHRGQFFPANLFTHRIFTVDYDHYQRDANSPHVIVTSGAGVWGPPLRMGTDNEVVSILAEFK